MARTTISRIVDAPVETVFDTVAHIENFKQAVPHITEVEFLSDTKRGVGTKFEETRVMRGRQATSTLEVTEYVENAKIRLVSDEGGTIWDSTFTVASDGDDRTKLDFVMEAKPYKLMAKIVNPIMKPIITKAIQGDLDAVKAYCEKP